MVLGAGGERGAMGARLCELGVFNIMRGCDVSLFFLHFWSLVQGIGQMAMLFGVGIGIRRMAS